MIIVTGTFAVDGASPPCNLHVAHVRADASRNGYRDRRLYEHWTLWVFGFCKAMFEARCTCTLVHIPLASVINVGFLPLDDTRGLVFAS